MNVRIEQIDRLEILDLVLPLIASYQEFYGCVPDDARNRQFFGELWKTPGEGVQFAAFVDGPTPVGFATLYFPRGSTTGCRYALMSDLFTHESARGRGVGQALLRHCQSVALRMGYSHLEWITQMENTSAQKLYDRLGGNKTSWYMYSLSTADEDAG